MSEIFYEPIFNLEETVKRDLINKIRNTPQEVFLSNDEEKIIESFYEDCSLEIIEAEEESGEIKDEKVLILSIPIKGDVRLIKYQPSSFNMPTSIKSPYLKDNEIISEIPINPSSNSEQINREKEWVLNFVRKNIANLNLDINRFNFELKQLTKQSIKNRIEEIKKTSDIISKLDIKLKKREDSPKTYIVPLKKKKIELITSKLVAENPSELEPILSNQTYEEVLNIIDNMAQVMERSPSAFVNMEEEYLRSHFLVQLNGQYEGEAMGEVFNLEGKTDILIRHKGENIFIAECKFWKGKEELLKAINQLLDYISWRDTKTALILFNQNKDTSKVLSQIPKVIKEHSNYVKSEKYEKEKSFRFIMKNRNDGGKHFILTIKLFDVPK